MGLEAATLISQLVVTNPVGATDPKSQGDDHLRLIKIVLKTQFPNFVGAITPTDTEINKLVGVTASVEAMRGMTRTSQTAPYSVAAGDIGTLVDILNAGTITLPNLANDFACQISAIGGTLTLTSSSGTLNWYSSAGTGLPSGNRTIAQGSLVTVIRVGGSWRVAGGGIT